MEQGQYRASSPGGQQQLRISSLLSKPVASRPIIGEKEPLIQGWWSPKVQEIIPNYAFCYELAGHSRGAFATLFSFSESLGVDPVQSEVHSSGRKGKFFWKDDQGTHELLFDRPDQGVLSVSHVMEAR